MQALGTVLSAVAQPVQKFGRGQMIGI